MRIIKTVRLIGFIILGTSFISGCATTRFIQDAEQVKGLQAMTVVVNATMSQGRTFKPDALSLAENEDIARNIASMTAALLEEKGYAVAYRPVHTVGLYGIIHKEIEIVNDIGSKNVASPPFLIFPDGSKEKTMAAKLKEIAEGEDLKREDNPFGTTPVLVINADGRYISVGDIAGNVGRGALNVLASIGIILGGAVSNNIGFAELHKDMVHLTFRLFDPSTGTLIWEDEYKDSDNPDSETFLKHLEKMMKKLPQTEGRITRNVAGQTQ